MIEKVRFQLYKQQDPFGNENMARAGGASSDQQAALQLGGRLHGAQGREHRGGGGQ